MGRWSGWLRRWLVVPSVALASATLVNCGGRGPTETDLAGGQTGAGGSGGALADLGVGGEQDLQDGSGFAAGGSPAGGQGSGGRASGGQGGFPGSGGDEGGAGQPGTGGGTRSSGGSGGGEASGGNQGSGGESNSEPFVCPGAMLGSSGEGGFGGEGSQDCTAGRVYDALADACVVPIACDEELSPFGGGDGSEQSPFAVCSIEHLLAMGMAADGMSFVLAKSLDLSAVADLSPLEPSGNPFEGTICGAGRALVGATLSLPSQDTVGLFRHLGQGALVENLRLVDFQVTGDNQVGILGGRNDGTLSRVEASGTVLGYDSVGGLVGADIYGDIQDCETNGSVLGHAIVGGLVGQGLGSIVDSRSSATVEGISIVGGLVGLNVGMIEGSEAAGEVWGESFDIGGLVGESHGMVSDSRARGNVDGGASVGGLLGSSQLWIITAGSAASGDVTGDVNVGGLIGSTMKGEVVNCGASGDVTALGNVLGTGNAGGLVGHNQATIEGSFASGSVSSAKVAGGLVGVHEDWFINRIETSYALGNVSGDSEVGGLVGEVVLSTDPGGKVQTSYALGLVSGGEPKAGLVGAMPADYPVGYCYYLDQPPNSGPGTPLPLAEFSLESSFTWTFGGTTPTWIMSESLGRPILAWELE